MYYKSLAQFNLTCYAIGFKDPQETQRATEGYESYPLSLGPPCVILVLSIGPIYNN